MSDPVLIYNHWFLNLPFFNRFGAMTVWPNILVGSDYIHPLTVKHEKIHLRQQRSKARFWFYFTPLYFLKWGVNVVRYGPVARNSEGKLRFNMKPYFAIDWEREAYVLTSPGLLTTLGYPDLDSNPFEVV